MKTAKTLMLVVLAFCLISVASANQNSVKINVHTPDGFDQVVHPDIYYNPSGVFGYEYWMVITPYPADDAYYENPCLYCSHDGFDWTTPNGVTNPMVEDPDGRGTIFNSDPDMVYVPNEGKFYIYYANNTPAVHTMLLTYDGTTVTGPIELTDVYAKGSSQAIIYKDGTWYLYYCNTADQVEGAYTFLTHPWLMTSTNGVNFTGDTRIGLDVPVGSELWHMNNELLPDGHLRWILSVGDVNTTVYNAIAYVGESNNFTAPIDMQATPVVTPTYKDWDSNLIYRMATISDDNGFDLYYSCNTDDLVWSLMYARCELVNGNYQMVDPARSQGAPTNEVNREFNIPGSNKLLFRNSYLGSAITGMSSAVTPLYTEDSPYDIPTDGLVAWYRMDEGSGSTLIDSSGNGRNGTYTNATFTEGKYNGAVRFNGIDSKATVSNFPNMTNATILVTVRDVESRGSTGSTRNFLGTSDYAAVTGWSFGSNATMDKVAFSANSSSYFLQIGINGLQDDNEYTQLGLIYRSGGLAEIYRDNKLDKVATGKTYTNLTGGTLYIGASPSFYNNITIDNIMIYDRCLSQAELDQIYYDNLDNVSLYSNTLVTGDPFSGVANFIVPFENTQLISRLNAQTSDTVEIGGVTVREYNETVTPFIISTTFTLPVTTSDFQTAKHNAADTWSTSIPIVVVLVLLIFIGLLLAAVRGNMSTQDLTNAVIGLMILVVVITAGYGILSSFEGLI